MGIWAKKAADSLDRIRRRRKKSLIIHYGCQSLYDDREGLSPRIACIVVRDLDNEQTFSFAIHLAADKLKIPREEIPCNLDIVEKSLLEDFYEFVRDHPGNLWLHWNMINVQYGFETLAHRYFVLTGKNAPNIEMDDRINLASVVNGKYGDKYVDIPHIPNLMKLNGGVKRDFVAGVDEVELFKNGEYARLHASTISKVMFFSEVVHLVLDSKLKTQRASFLVRVERGVDHPIAKAIGILASAYALWDLAGQRLEALF